ncbi:MAG: cupin domain-containing protein [Spirochaetota bacterium]|nr:cupin domain-containing protein [Spirochaetota bacterium]
MKSDELWYFYCGDSITSHIIELDGIYSQIKLGNNIDNGELFQVIVKA